MKEDGGDETVCKAPRYAGVATPVLAGYGTSIEAPVLDEESFKHFAA